MIPDELCAILVNDKRGALCWPNSETPLNKLPLLLRADLLRAETLRPVTF